MRNKDIINTIEAAAPVGYQESYDNTGWQVGNPDEECTGVLIALDVTMEVLREALESGCNLIIAHHPLLFGSIKKLTGRNYVERIIIKAIQESISIYACHTNLDNMARGVNARIAARLGLKEVRILQPSAGNLLKLVTYVPSAHSQADVYKRQEYDIATNVWTRRADFPGTNRHHPFQFSIGSYSYSGLGHDGSAVMATSDLYRYDPSDDTWEQMADAPGGRIAGTQFDYDGYGFVLSGEGNYHMPSTPSIFWKYDPAADAWQELESHPGGSLWAPGSFIIDGTLYLFGGVYRPMGPEVYFKDMWAYDLENAASSSDKVNNTIAVQLFPNPATRTIHIKFGDQKYRKHVRIYDIKGSVVFADQAIRQDEISINTENLYPGNYFVEIMDDAGATAVARFVKE